MSAQSTLLTLRDTTFEAFGRACRVALVMAGVTIGTMSLASSAMAAAASSLSTSAEPIPATVSVSRDGLVTYAAYRVTVTNTGGNTTNKVVYEGTTQVLPATSTSTAPAIESTNANCKKTTSGLGFTCALGQMAAGASQSFLLIFQAPTVGDANNPNAQVKLNPSLSFCSNTTCGATNNVTVTTTPAFTDLITTDSPAIASGVQSAIPSFGGSFFTGVGSNQTSSAGLHTTKVDVPSGAPVSNNAIQEANVTATVPFNCDASKPKYVCYGFASQVTVNRADTGAKIYLTGNSMLTMTLTQDVSTIKPGTKIADVQLYYQYDIVDPVTGLPVLDMYGNPTVSDALVSIPACKTGLPAINQPCVTGRTVVPKNSPGAGNFVFVILARDNGRVSW